MIFSFIFVTLLIFPFLPGYKMFLSSKAINQKKIFDKENEDFILQQQKQQSQLLSKNVSVDIHINQNPQLVVFSSNHQKQINHYNTNNNNNNSKFVIINFDDGFKGQYEYAKSVLDKYRFKATFFIVCNYVGSKDNRMNWDNIESLSKEGYDIQAHTMTHKDLDKMSQKDLDYEIGQSKQCLLDRGINSTVFAYPRASGSDNATVVKEVAKHYDLARTGFSPLIFLKCNGEENQSSNVQKDCRTYYDNGSLTSSNRYSLKGWMHERVTGDNFKFNDNFRGNDNVNIYVNPKSYYGNYSRDNDKTFENFIKVVESQTKYNRGISSDNNGNSNNNTDGINAIPIITYHDIINGTVPFKKGNLQITTDLGLFKQEMKYLHDNGFNVITLKDIGYNPVKKYLYIK